MSFKAKLHYNDTIIRDIYAVQETEHGVLQFLIYDDYFKRWAWQPASEYVPVPAVTTTKRSSRGGRE